MARHLESEEEVRVGPGWAGEIIVDGVGWAAEGMTAQRTEAATALGEAQLDICNNVYDATQAECPRFIADEAEDGQGNGCAMGLLKVPDEDDYLKEAVYHCPRGEEICGRLVLAASRRAEHRMANATKAVISALREFQ